MTPSETKSAMLKSPEFWFIPFMDFVDDFRRNKTIDPLALPLTSDNERINALLASTIEFLCNETGNDPPRWVNDIPGCRDPWFVSGMENLKAIAIVESPVWYRTRKIFVLANFLTRV
jgi:hypothetical protein